MYRLPRRHAGGAGRGQRPPAPDQHAVHAGGRGAERDAGVDITLFDAPIR